MSARKIIDSTSVLDYELPVALKMVFEEFNDLQRYMTDICGKPALRFVRLDKRKYSDLDDVIRNKSDKRHSIRDVKYQGLPIISANETAPA